MAAGGSGCRGGVEKNWITRYRLGAVRSACMMFSSSDSSKKSSDSSIYTQSQSEWHRKHYQIPKGSPITRYLNLASGPRPEPEPAASRLRLFRCKSTWTADVHFLAGAWRRCPKRRRCAAPRLPCTHGRHASSRASGMPRRVYEHEEEEGRRAFSCLERNDGNG